MSQGTRKSKWTFLSNHSHVLICLVREPELSLREVALKVGITERAVQNIILDLEDGGFLTRRKEGRVNRYSLALDTKLRHPLESNCTVRELMEALK
jgi:DNA-binding transcriptional ArsR family regulator